ncbi:MAG: hypothetical protein HC803_08475 [Saprospiraceae bacterium]|nr:hypothetical protein [Saprospiraceae bacterium]
MIAIFQNSLTAQSYYPLEIGTSWNYTVTDYATSDMERTNLDAMVSGAHKREKWGSVDIRYSVKKDSLVNGKLYKVITNSKDPFLVELVREEDGNYLRLNSTTFKEENFLKTDVEVGNMWLDYENEEQTMATLYVVSSFDNQKTIKGKTYQNVIGIGQITAPVTQIIAFLNEENPFIPTKYYSKGVGLIYSYFPYPLSGTYSDVEITMK